MRRRIAMLALLAVSLASPTLAGSLLVEANGTGDAPTINAAIALSAPGDTILLGAGTFLGAGNAPFSFTNTFVVVISLNGPHATIIAPGPGLRCLTNPGGGDCVVIGLTLRGGSPTLGGAVDMDNTNMVFENCIFENNSATVGGAIQIRGNSQPTFRNCTFVGNSSPNGNHLYYQSSNAGGLLERCIFAYGGDPAGGVAQCNGATPTWTCNVIYANAGGDALCGPSVDNVVADPLFCDYPGGDLYLNAASPAAGALSACGLLIGACPVQCGATPVRETSWGAIKTDFDN